MPATRSSPPTAAGPSSGSNTFFGLALVVTRHSEKVSAHHLCEALRKTETELNRSGGKNRLVKVTGHRELLTEHGEDAVHFAFVLDAHRRIERDDGACFIADSERCALVDWLNPGPQIGANLSGQS